MCYNSNCRIEIVSCIDGEKTTFSVKGQVKKTSSGFCFDYTLDGDECTLTVKDDEAVQSRRGEQNIVMTFRKGMQTQCFLQSGDFSGAFPIYTETMEYAIFGSERKSEGLERFTLSIAYVLGEQKTEIKFSAEYTLEGKK